MSALIILIIRRPNYIINGLCSKNNLFKNLKCNNVITQNHKLNYSIKLNKTRLTYKNSLLKIKDEFLNSKSIRTTNPNRLPPIFWLIIRPVLNVVAVLGYFFKLILEVF
jgi:hypothetical protein